MTRLAPNFSVTCPGYPMAMTVACVDHLGRFLAGDARAFGSTHEWIVRVSGSPCRTCESEGT